ncbi:lipopolysaccharide A protein [Photobacterium sp. SDRW27]|uniref:glycosyl transferase family 90 n=1 Tax=Photobacterium obscurum TaxID=2829490 RepID=UPI002242E255|nr:glycosyl transferase family 90 [Photobacterium obscurum]MCW8329585.1 lipopolysaccharide A protein [Photobacterium obscurum]
MSNKYNNSKLTFYANGILRECIPGAYYRNQLAKKLQKADDYDASYITQRVNYYLKHENVFDVGSKAVRANDLSYKHKSAYYFDLREYLHYFPEHLKFAYRFGDKTHIEANPTIVKARPIAGENANSVLINLDKCRHFNFITDPYSFTEKKDILVWRGGVYRQHRKDFIQAFYNHPMCDVGQTNKPVEDVPWQKGYMGIEEQLQHKFILCVEGNDVATNLKWAMSSNSLCMMNKPKFETWFMEGTLKAGVHYVELADDYSDLEEKLQYYAEHTDEALKIIDNAHKYVAQFQDKEREDLIALLVLKKYFELSQQSI